MGYGIWDIYSTGDLESVKAAGFGKQYIHKYLHVLT